MARSAVRRNAKNETRGSRAFEKRAGHSSLSIFLLDSSYYPWGWVSLEGDHHALVLIRVVHKFHLNPVFKLDLNQSVVHHLTSGHVGIHDVVETGFRPSAFLPVGDAFPIPKEVDGGSDGKVHVTQRELNVKLADTDLCRELTHDGGQV